MHVRIDIELADVTVGVAIEVLEQVDRREVARRVVEMHVLAARVAGVDPTCVVRGVPPVDRGVELQSRIGAVPRSLGDVSPEVTGADRTDDLAAGDRLESPVGVLDDCLHEFVRHPNRIVRVLILDRKGVGSVEIHVEAGVSQHTSLALLLDLAPDELFDIGVVGVENDHLGGAPRLAARLDRSG